MAERKTPARKKTTKRGPTKAAALKALGLTTEDLEALKKLRAQAERPDTGVAVEASATLSPNTADPQSDLEDRPAPQPQEVSVPQAQETPTFYMRNLRGVDVGFRLTRQTKQGEKRTNLKPRGQRGDMVKLEDGDLKDAELQTQVSYGLIEIIPEGEALEALKKQYTNRQNEVPAHIAMLRNERGEEYQTAPRTATDEEAMGYKVADLDPGLMQGRLSDREIRQGGGFAQNAERTPVQGNAAIISDGFMAPTQTDGGGDNEKAAEVDALARSKQFEGPGAGLGEVTVKVAPVQRMS